MVDDAELVEALRGGDESAFRRVVTQYHSALVRTARCYVLTEAAAEEVAQETWLAVIRGIDQFGLRSTFKTWLFHIAVNQARTRAVQDARTVPIALDDDIEASVPASRFLPRDHPRWPRHWAVEPSDWSVLPEAAVDSVDTRHVIDATILMMQPLQRQVITLRDIDGVPADEVCQILGITPGNQRVLLHRARSKVRTRLEVHFQGVATA
jgi:RNA polymerase sigma-70 factor (ECF subfamily)